MLIKNLTFEDLSDVINKRWRDFLLYTRITKKTKFFCIKQGVWRALCFMQKILEKENLLLPYKLRFAMKRYREEL